MTGAPVGPGLIWAVDLVGQQICPVEDTKAPFAVTLRWLHLNLADQGTRDWLGGLGALPLSVRELLVSVDGHQRALVDEGVVGCVLHDFERDFDEGESSRIGSLHVALTPTLIVTTRLHPLRSADIVRQRLTPATLANGPAGALDLIVSAISEVVGGAGRAMGAEVQRSEDAFLDGHHPPSTRELIGMRRKLALIHRMLGGMRAVFERLEEDEDLPEALLATVEKLSQRLQSLDGDILAVQGQLRLLRDEIDLVAEQQTNQNLYILSIMTALMLPATLVTGIFGMNTGGLPWAGTSYGTLFATGLAVGTAAATYVLLRWMGFMRR